MSTTKVVTGKRTRFSFPVLFEPAARNAEDTPKYSICLLIPKSDKTTVKKIEKAIEAAQNQGKETKWGGKLPKKLTNPLRDGDEKADEGYEEFRGHYFINAKSNQRPGVVDESLNAIQDPEEIYAGCYGRASINFYAYDFNGNRGVGAGLNNIQKLDDGERLGGGASRPEDDFEVEEDEDDLL